jgi:predicted nuclease with TOPRIM domain
METVRETWTDERLDAFGERVDWRMNRLEVRMDTLDVRMDTLDVRMDRLEGRIDRLETRMEEGFKELRGEIGAFQRAMIMALVALFASQVGLIATQL